MLNNTIKGICLIGLYLTLASVSLAAEHHGGHKSGGSNGGGSGCPKFSISNIKPAPLSEVPAGSDFSAMVVGAKEADDISVTAKQIPVEIEAINKEDFFLVKGKLPKELHSTAARINIKVKGKVANCNEENGWLLKIQN